MMTSALKKANDGWTPVLRGGVYCSPRCGGKCTKKAFDRATKEADKLCKTLGPGWKPRVWENLGWHYEAAKGPFKVHVYECRGDVSYWAEVMVMDRQFLTDQFHDPNEALGILKQGVRTFASKINEVCKAVLEE
jgi:hypothetical protein